MAKIDLRRLCATILPVNYVVYEFTIIWAKIECFSDGFGYGHRRTQFQLVCILHRRYTQFWHVLAKQRTKVAGFCGFAGRATHDKILLKTLDFCLFLVYYMQRYSGIVQSVEQRTVNPYVTGSSPVARATSYNPS